MAGELILITGATGHIGFHVLMEALAKGYKVRIAVRSDAKFEALKAAKPLESYHDQLGHIIVPNIEQEGAYDEALNNVSYVIHIASPLARPSDDPEATIVRPAINATLGLLKSALKHSSIKKVVITSSIAAVMPDSPTGPFTTDKVVPDPQRPFPHLFAAYTASKKISYNATRSLIAQRNPHFSVVHIMPSFVLGPIGLATTKEEVMDGSNRGVFLPILGETGPLGLPSAFCHTSDVAYVHVAALSDNVTGNQNFGISNRLSEQSKWDDAIDVVKKHFPKEVECGMFPLGGTTASVPTPFDASKTEDFFGTKFKSFEEMVKDTAGQYVELAR